MTGAGVLSGLLIAAVFWAGYVLGARAERRQEQRRTQSMLDDAVRRYEA
jgi:hypothetical protein